MVCITSDAPSEVIGKRLHLRSNGAVQEMEFRGRKRKLGRGQAEIAANSPLWDVTGERSVERVRSGNPVQNPSDGGGHASLRCGRVSGKRGGKGRGRGGA